MAARDAAVAAREAAGQVFFDMDQAQKFVAGRLTLLGDLDRDAAARLHPRFTAADTAADEAAAAYIAVLDAHDLDDPDRSMIEYEDADRAIQGTVASLRRAGDTLNRLAADLGPLLERAEAALDDLTPLLRAAREAMQAARTAIDVAAAAEMDTAEIEAEYDEARDRLAVVTEAGLGGLGLRGAMDRAREVRERAAGIGEEARSLAGAAARTRNDLASVRTRVQMAESRRERVEDAMSALRRGYSADCWSDLQGAPQAIGQALERALDRLDEAARAAADADWRTAGRAVAAARTELKDAERRSAKVTGRVEELADVARDPQAPLERARFAVRDAQRLAVAAPGGLDPRHARVLDGLVERLERAPDLLHGAHPDYWAYLRELRAIEDRARDVVELIRSERAGG